MGQAANAGVFAAHAHGDDDHVGGGIQSGLGRRHRVGATTDILNAASNYVTISGTTTITGLGSNNGAWRAVEFQGALTLTNNGFIILPGGANITTRGATRRSSSGGRGCSVYCLYEGRAGRQ